ncbi:MAG: hypothetical protein JXA18_12060 [Chitinispirillaceae bacterium]|nr:hypothetical protein [Chitinispirillaceae bacterium]
MCYKLLTVLLFANATIFSRSFTLLSPNGGEIFRAEQVVTVQWVEDTIITDTHTLILDLQYSVDGKQTWWKIGYDGIISSGSFSWTVPHLQYRSESAYLRMKPMACIYYDADSTLVRINLSDQYSYDTTDAPFTILPSTTDPYESNDSFATACELSLGDRAVENAIIMRSVPTDIGVPKDDVDYFKLSLTADKIVIIRRIYDDTYYDIHSVYPPMGISIRLYDASQNQINAGNDRLLYSITQSGVYYFKITTYQSQLPPWERYSLSIKEIDNAITLLSPNGGENLRTGDKLKISWETDPAISRVKIYYSIDSGASWYGGMEESGDTFLWDVLPLIKKTDQALIKVEIADVTSPSFDISNGPFTIQSIPLDAYEPNNDLASAYPIAVGDSVVTHATTGPYVDYTTQSPMAYDDEKDFYKVSLPAYSFVIIHPWLYLSEDRLYLPADTSSMEHYWSHVRMCRSDEINDTFDIVYKDLSHCYFINESGVHYFEVTILGGFASSWKEYGVSIHALRPLYSQTSVIDSASIQQISDEGNKRYITQLYADTTNLTFNLIYDEYYRYNTPQSITTMIFDPDDLPTLPDIKKKVKAFAVTVNGESIYDAQIVIPYSLSDLKGYSEQSLTVVAFDNSIPRWENSQTTIDSVNHRIIVKANPYLSIALYQVYISSEKAAVIHTQKPIATSGITADYLPQMGHILIRSHLPKAIPATLQLFNLHGQCIKKETVMLPGSENGTHFWNPGRLTSGNYFLRVVTGAVHVNKPLLIIR